MSEARDATVVRFEGVQTPFERSAYDLSLATSSLADIDPQLALHLSRTSSYQDVANELGRGLMEPGPLEAYAVLIPAIDAALAN